jgi:hypothetical protein
MSTGSFGHDEMPRGGEIQGKSATNTSFKDIPPGFSRVNYRDVAEAVRVLSAAPTITRR